MNRTGSFKDRYAGEGISRNTRKLKSQPQEERYSHARKAGAAGTVTEDGGCDRCVRGSKRDAVAGGAARPANQKQFRRSGQASGHWTTLPSSLAGRRLFLVAAGLSPTVIELQAQVSTAIFLRQPEDTPSLSLRDIHEYGHDVQPSALFMRKERQP